MKPQERCPGSFTKYSDLCYHRWAVYHSCPVCGRSLKVREYKHSSNDPTHTYTLPLHKHTPRRKQKPSVQVKQKTYSVTIQYYVRGGMCDEDILCRGELRDGDVAYSFVCSSSESDGPYITLNKSSGEEYHYKQSKFGAQIENAIWEAASSYNDGEDSDTPN
jgi:hypothetical protein